LPDTFLTKICMVSAGSGDAERDIDGEDRILAVRLMAVRMVLSMKGVGLVSSDEIRGRYGYGNQSVALDGMRLLHEATIRIDG
jgi:hypothetical protein